MGFWWYRRDPNFDVKSQIKCLLERKFNVEYFFTELNFCFEPSPQS